MNTPTDTRDDEMTDTKRRFMTADFKGSYGALPEGRQWAVHSDSGADYVVTVWTDPTFGRMARCSCKAAEFGTPCKHLRFVQMSDTFLTNAPVRELRPVCVPEFELAAF